MFKSILFALFVTRGFCSGMDPSKAANGANADDTEIAHLKWNEFVELAGIDEKLISSCKAEELSEAFCCTPKPGPDRLDCPGAISAWDGLAESSNLHVKGGECITATNKRCRTSVCALWGDLKVDVNEVIGRMWNPLSMKCVMGGKGGILESEDLDFIIEMGMPEDTSKD